MPQVKDREWLKITLAQAVGWEPAMMEGVADAIATAESKEEVDQLIEDYLGGGPEVRRIVQTFYGDGRAQQHKGRKQADMQMRGQQQGSSKASLAKGFVELSGGRTRQGGAKERPAGSMTIIHKQDKRKPAVTEAQPPSMDRAVANCLCCGKIYDCRLKSSDVQRFVESGGVCTFCAAKVALSRSESSEVRAPASQRKACSIPESSSEDASPSDGSQMTPSDSTAASRNAEAIAFKNRLVDYDRNAAKRTTVIDDQSDFFEIDSNAWLSREERQQLKERQKALEEAEKARKRSVTVTFDLLGRQVIMANNEGAGPGEPSAAGSNASLAASAAAATAAEIPQGGGTAVQAAAEAAGLGGNAPMVLRMRPNPGLQGPSPVFMRRSAEPKSGPSRRVTERLQQNASRKQDFQRLQHDDLLLSSFQTLSVQ